ncbi:MAG: hypothetical protein B6244_12690 [Candidatus Cloacimonetes bacterium 4572_55]|nr:MAG: hypothetical protein B6244_12690 [Candidatus Cloacimonetes bacterium 4572_55]
MRRYNLFFLTILVLSISTGCAERKNILDGGNEDNTSYTLVGQVQTPGFGQDLAITDTLIVVADDETGLTVISVKDKSAPFIVSSHRTTLFPFGVDLIPSERIILTAEGSGDVGVYSYQNPDTLSDISTIYAQSAQDVIFARQFVPAYNDTAESMFLFVADSRRDFLGYELLSGVDSEGNPRLNGIEIKEIHSAGTGQGIDFVDGYIYLASGDWGLHILDARDLTDITAIGGEFGGIDTNGYSYSVKVHDNIAYLANGQKGLQVIDVSDKNNPILLASVDTRSAMVDLAVSDDGNLVFAAITVDGLYIFDVSNPADPKIIQRYNTPNARAVDTDGDYVYVIDRYDGLIILQKELR